MRGLRRSRAFEGVSSFTHDCRLAEPTEVLKILECLGDEMSDTDNDVWL